MVEQKQWTVADMESRVVRYSDLRPCYNAFIDTRTPGSEKKENFTIIGPGVSENPEQYVHIAEPHGFNIGGARQPPLCVNSQHSHDTAEVFVVHTGHWRFDLGEDGTDAQVELAPGDVISIPTKVFRGFTNIGEDIGYLWAVLGQDDPGRVTWAPKVFDMAQDYGLVLLETGQLIDTTKGESIPEGKTPMPRTSAAQVAALHRMTPQEAQGIVARAPVSALGETQVIGPGAPLGWEHGFTLSRLELSAGGRDATAPHDVEVIFVHRGALTVTWEGGSIELGEGDTMTVPPCLERGLSSKADVIAFIARRDH